MAGPRARKVEMPLAGGKLEPREDLEALGEGGLEAGPVVVGVGLLAVAQQGLDRGVAAGPPLEDDVPGPPGEPVEEIREAQVGADRQVVDEGETQSEIG